MSSFVTGLVAMDAALLAGAVWITARGSAFVHPEALPTRLRTRLRWWLRHERHAYIGCAVAFVAAGLTHLAPLLI